MVSPTAPIRERQSELGQFLTPSHIADLMVSMFSRLPRTIRLLDAGAGAGALTWAFVNRCCTESSRVKSISADLYEIDPEIIGALSQKMRECAELCERSGIEFLYAIHQSDFVSEMSLKLRADMFESPPPEFNIIISNPPYRKITSNSSERSALSLMGIETSNLYAGFISIMMRLLGKDGQLVAITPRSFCNGPYFRSFREDFFSHLKLCRIHLFDSRESAFHSDAVLQENVIFHAHRSDTQPQQIIISTSSGKSDETQISKVEIPFKDILHPNDAGMFIHIPVGSEQLGAKHIVDQFGFTLSAMGVSVSTGPVVDFRLKSNLRMNPEAATVPLLYPCHFTRGTIHWPQINARKPNAILQNEETKPWLIPAGTYVLTKRFTSKEERRRLVAFFLDPIALQSEWVGVENHLNYFHSNGGGLGRDFAAGLFAYLNSTIVDQYFRRFSGHTQVNATDLRSLKYPGRAVLEEIGRVMGSFDLSQAEIDDLVMAHIQ